MAGDIALSSWTEQCLPPPSCINGYRRILKMLGVTLRWTGIRNTPGRFMLPKPRTQARMDYFVRTQTLVTFIIDNELEKPVQARQKVLKITL